MYIKCGLFFFFSGFLQDFLFGFQQFDWYISELFCLEFLSPLFDVLYYLEKIFLFHPCFPLSVDDFYWFIFTVIVSSVVSSQRMRLLTEFFIKFYGRSVSAVRSWAGFGFRYCSELCQSSVAVGVFQLCAAAPCTGEGGPFLRVSTPPRRAPEWLCVCLSLSPSLHPCSSARGKPLPLVILYEDAWVLRECCQLF